MLGKILLHALFIAGCTLLGSVTLGAYASLGTVGGAIGGGGIGAVGVGVVLLLEKWGGKRLGYALSGVAVGCFVGGLFGIVVGAGGPGGTAFFLLVGAYAGLLLGLYIEKAKPSLLITAGNHDGSGLLTDKIFDTSVIIDGRVAELCKAGFLEGAYIIPQFVLRELQHIADSTDPIRRGRGRRGLDILHGLQEDPNLTVKVVDDDFPGIREVDSKIIALGKRRAAKVVTNDVNLSRVATLQGVKVLNINHLCSALKPVVMAGDQIQLAIVKEGKELNQGVGYLDDGTMVVVDDARCHIGKQMDIVVTGALQTTAGRMIFSKLRDEPKEELRILRKT